VYTPVFCRTPAASNNLLPATTPLENVASETVASASHERPALFLLLAAALALALAL